MIRIMRRLQVSSRHSFCRIDSVSSKRNLPKDYTRLQTNISKWFRLRSKDWLSFPDRPDTRFIFRTECTEKVGRSQEIQKIWKNLHSVSKSPSQLSDCFYIHGSPGLGKSFLLRAAMQKDAADATGIPQDFVEKTMFIALDFNINICRRIENFAGQFSHLQSESLPILRLFHTEFIRDDLLWPLLVQQFLSLASNDKRQELEIVSTLKFLFKIKASYLNCSHLVVLVDEINKTNILDSALPEKFRSAICSWSDSSNFGSFILASIFSTLDRKLIQNERSSSFRRVVAVSTLPLFTQSESLVYLKNNMKCRFQDEIGIALDYESSLIQVASVCGGYPRALELVSRMFNSELAPVHVTDVIIQAARNLSDSYPYELWHDVIKLALLGKTMSLEEKVPGLNETIESLINRGMLLGSLNSSTQQIEPYLPEIYLYMWSRPDTSRGTKAQHKEERELLYRLLMTCRSFTSKKWESFHIIHELLMRKIRPHHYESVKLSSLYSADEEELKQELLSSIINVEVDGKSELSKLIYTKGETIQLVPNHIYIPSDVNNPGWDSLIIYEVKTPPEDIHSEPQKYIMPVFIQNKFSADAATTKYSISDIKKCAKACENFLESFTKCPPGFHVMPSPDINQNGTNKFVLVFIAKSKCTTTLQEKCPSNVIPLFKEDIKRLYGLTLAELIDKLEPGRDVYVQSTDDS